MKGIYIITCKVSNKFYIGSSLNIKVRIKRHFKDLRLGTHHNLHLQRAFNLYGEEAFNHKVLFECEDIKSEEQKLLDTINWDQCFNISKNSCGGDNYTNHPNKEEFRKRLVTLLDKCRPVDADLNLSKNPNWRGGTTFKKCSCGNNMSYNAKKCIRCSNKGDENPFHGKKHLSSTKKLISDKRKIQGYVGNQQRKVIIGGKEFESVSEAARQMKVTPNTIINRIRNPKFKDYKYKD